MIIIILILLVAAVFILFWVGWYFSIRDYWREWPGLHDFDTEKK